MAARELMKQNGLAGLIQLVVEENKVQFYGYNCFRFMIGSNVELKCNLITKLGTIKVRHIGTCILVNSAVLFD